MGNVFLWKSWIGRLGLRVRLFLVDIYIFAVLLIILYAIVFKVWFLVIGKTKM